MQDSFLSSIRNDYLSGVLFGPMAKVVDTLIAAVIASGAVTLAVTSLVFLLEIAK